MISLKTLDRWSLMKPEEGVVFEGRHARKIRLHVNAPDVARLYLVDGKRRRFLARFCGLDVIEFVAAGNVQIATMDDDVWFYCAEQEPTHREVVDPVVFTKIAQRKSRNPELEQMMFLMNQNIERRFAAQEAAHARELAALKKGKDDGGEINVHERSAAEPAEPDEGAAQGTAAGGGQGADKSADPKQLDPAGAVGPEAGGAAS